jgi:hypothetical protein
MCDEINRINQILPHTPATGTIAGGKNEAIKRWIESAYRKKEHYTTEHYRLLREAAILIELALWKAKLEENEKDSQASMSRCKSSRSELRITSGADIVIKNVLLFLRLE